MKVYDGGNRTVLSSWSLGCSRAVSSMAACSETSDENWGM